MLSVDQLLMHQLSQLDIGLGHLTVAELAQDVLELLRVGRAAGRQRRLANSGKWLLARLVVSQRPLIIILI